MSEGFRAFGDAAAEFAAKASEGGKEERRRRIPRWHLVFVSNASHAILWRAEDLVRAGMTFEAAKAKAIKEAHPALRHLSKEIADDIRHLSLTARHGDLHHTTRRLRTERILAEIEKRRGKRAGRFERWLFHLTGLTF